MNSVNYNSSHDVKKSLDRFYSLTLCLLGIVLQFIFISTVIFELYYMIGIVSFIIYDKNNSFGLIFTIDLIIIVLGFNLVFNYVMACSIDAGSVNNTK